MRGLGIGPLIRLDGLTSAAGVNDSASSTSSEYLYAYDMRGLRDADTVWIHLPTGRLHIDVTRLGRPLAGALWIDSPLVAGNGAIATRVSDHELVVAGDRGMVRATLVAADHAGIGGGVILEGNGASPATLDSLVERYFGTKPLRHTITVGW